MQSEERQKRIEEYLMRTEFASLDELSELVDASVSTVRRDVSLLEARGAVRRTHGGARILTPRTDEFAFTSRDTHQLEEKEAIGRACAGLIGVGQTVIVDAGTTCYHVARYLEETSPYLITNSLPVANLFSGSGKVEVVVSGGVIYPRLGVLVGPQAVECFTRVHADVAVMSAGGITLEGVTNSHGLLIEIQRAMMRAARRVILCMDSTKFGRRSISPLCGIDSVQVLVTDGGVAADQVRLFRKAGLEVVVAAGK